ncbi:MAG: hypothetical protein WA085_12625 [Sphingobium sp.]
MTEAQTRLRRLLNEFPYYATNALRIRDKRGRVVPFELNSAQLLLHERVEAQLSLAGKIRALVLKGRQQGISTYIEGRFYHKTSTTPGRRAVIMTHEAKATANLFGMAKLFHACCPDNLKPTASKDNANELMFSRLMSSYKVLTAGASETGRGDTVQLFHGCLSPDSLIVSGETGALRRMGDFDIGELVRTHTGEIAPVSFISRQQKAARSLVMKGMGATPLVATDEHRFWTRDGWKHLRDIKAGDEIGFPVARIEDRGISWPFRLPDAVRPQGGGCRETGPDRVAPSYELGRVLGLYLAEGCITKQSKTKVPSAVSFAIHERETARTVEWLNAVPGLFVSAKVVPRNDSKTVTVTAYGKSFAHFVLALCGELDSKRVPEGWNSCGDDFVRGMVHGYLAGDGHSSKRAGDRRISAPSIRSAITVGMRDALASLGYGWAGISWRDGAIRNGRDERTQWTLRLCGIGVDRLVGEIGWTMPPRKRVGAYGDVRVEGGYAWVPVLRISEPEMVEVMDFEVDHDDHSYCTLQGATHNSEAAFWANAAKHMAGVGQAIADMEGTEIFLESTANGVGNPFHQAWQDAEAGLTEYIPVFLPWFLQTEYRRIPPDGFVLDTEEAQYATTYDLDEFQMAWRRNKIRSDFKGDVGLFNQEYPASPELAFIRAGGESYISQVLVAAARKNKAEARGAKVLGIDPAEFGSDRSTFVLRQGLRVLKTKKFSKLDLMELVGHASMMIHEEKPDAVFVDAVGVGAGVYSRLAELFPNRSIIRVHSGAAAFDKETYANVRAEMWGNMREWFTLEPQIPDSDEFAADLCAPGYSYDSARRVLLESKEKMKSAGVRSPDFADALAMTFFMHVEVRDNEMTPLQQKLASIRKRQKRSAMAA